MVTVGIHHFLFRSCYQQGRNEKNSPCCVTLLQSDRNHIYSLTHQQIHTLCALSGEMSEDMKKVDLFISSQSHQSLREGALDLLKHVREEWKKDEVKFKIFTDGITNHLLGCYLEDQPDDIVLVRVYGQKTELFIDRGAEVKNMHLVYKAGFGSPLYCAFTNGLCYGYQPGVTLDAKLVTDPFVSSCVAQLMARMHNIRQMTVNGVGPHPSLFRVIRRFLELVPDSFEDKEKDKRLKVYLPSKEVLKTEINKLEIHLSQLGSPVVFCHNDLLLKNIIFNKEKGTVAFVDYEYADYNYQAFDIGNHFCEFAGVDTFVPENYPDRSFQIQWLQKYLEASYALKYKDRREITNDEVEVLYIQVNKFALVC
ncbi:ethanolamine kinase 1 isoform X2 [Centruroides vittatus]|uniref:ethanolamine kinase 1 isoform X2 n=1 Tax=Centruroides vittatus TaxID=120091 RepID=UPI00350F2FA5